VPTSPAWNQTTNTCAYRKNQPGICFKDLPRIIHAWLNTCSGRPAGLRLLPTALKCCNGWKMKRRTLRPLWQSILKRATCQSLISAWAARFRAWGQRLRILPEFHPALPLQSVNQVPVSGNIAKHGPCIARLHMKQPRKEWLKGGRFTWASICSCLRVRRCQPSLTGKYTVFRTMPSI